MRRTVFLVLAVVGLVFLLSACAAPSGAQYQDVSASVNSMQQIYGRVFNGSLDAWQSAVGWAPFWWAVFWFVVAVVVITVLGAMGDDVGTGLTVGIVVGLLAGAIAFGVMRGRMLAAWPKNADAQAVNAMTVGVDQARFNKANQYVEELHVPVVMVDRLWRDCSEVNNGRNSCGSYVPEWTYDWNYREVCVSHDKDGNCEATTWEHDTMHVPYVRRIAKQVVFVSLLDRLASPETGLMPTEGVENLPHHDLTDWRIPPDFEWYDGGRTTDLSGYDLSVDPQWQWFYDELYQNGRVTLLSVPHIYVNWLFTADAQGLTTISVDIDRYEAAGLLPSMNEIYSRHGFAWATDYDFVQTVGGLTLTDEQKAVWEEYAAAFSNVFSPQRQGSLTIVFAPANKVDNLDAWADAAKANYSIKRTTVLDGETRWRMLPKNAFILLCTVDEPKQIVTACRFRTGMPKGNEKGAQDIAQSSTPEMQNVSFTPEGFFGQMTTTPEDKGGGVWMPTLSFSGQPRPMSLLMRDPADGGVKRTKMGDYDWLQASIKLEPAEVDKLVADQVAVQAAKAHAALMEPLIWTGGFILAVITLILVVAFGQR